MKMRRLIALPIVCACAWAPAFAATVGPDWCVAYPESGSADVNAVLKTIAEEVRADIGEATGLNLKVVPASKAKSPAIYIGERFGLMPEIYIADNQLTGALFTNDEIRVKARHFPNVMVADYRPIYKSNVSDR